MVVLSTWCFVRLWWSRLHFAPLPPRRDPSMSQLRRNSEVNSLVATLSLALMETIAHSSRRNVHMEAHDGCLSTWSGRRANQ
eukprot:745572-Amphidinium_carterae.1